jgi:hypothetical protein
MGEGIVGYGHKCLEARIYCTERAIVAFQVILSLCRCQIPTSSALLYERIPYLKDITFQMCYIWIVLPLRAQLLSESHDAQEFEQT